VVPIEVDLVRNGWVAGEPNPVSRDHLRGDRDRVKVDRRRDLVLRVENTEDRDVRGGGVLDALTRLKDRRIAKLHPLVRVLVARNTNTASISGDGVRRGREPEDAVPTDSIFSPS
jgi:hypothetical protein